MARRNSVVVALAAAAALSAALPTAARAQDDMLRRLNIDKLEVQSLGVSFGRVIPSQVVPANIIGLQGDYGNITPTWRVVFGASYWQSRFEDDVVQTFADSLHKSLSDPSGHVVVSPIRIYDVTFSADLRYSPRYSGWIKPFAGLGIAAHVVNAEGQLIKGTFVERSLDDIAGGTYAIGGLNLELLRHIGIEASARGDLLSGFRSTQVKVGLSYVLGKRKDGSSSSSGAGSERHDRSGVR